MSTLASAHCSLSGRDVSSTRSRAHGGSMASSLRQRARRGRGSHQPARPRLGAAPRPQARPASAQQASRSVHPADPPQPAGVPAVIAPEDWPHALARLGAHRRGRRRARGGGRRRRRRRRYGARRWVGRPGGGRASRLPAGGPLLGVGSLCACRQCAMRRGGWLSAPAAAAGGALGGGPCARGCGGASLRRRRRVSWGGGSGARCRVEELQVRCAFQ
jgi:hypothetical protein